MPLIGVSFEHVVRNSRRSGRTVRLWVERFNAQGIDGLIYRPRPGRPRKLAGQTVVSEVLPVVDDPASAGQTHWTVVKLRGWPSAPGIIFTVHRSATLDSGPWQSIGTVTGGAGNTASFTDPTAFQKVFYRVEFTP